MPISDERLEEKRQWTEFVINLRRALGWTQEFLAGQLMRSHAAVSRWEDPDPERGRVPCKLARRHLVDIARQHGLLKKDEDAG